MCEFTQREYRCGHFKFIAARWCNLYRQTHRRCPPDVTHFEYRGNEICVPPWQHLVRRNEPVSITGVSGINSLADCCRNLDELVPWRAPRSTSASSVSSRRSSTSGISRSRSRTAGRGATSPPPPFSVTTPAASSSSAASTRSAATTASAAATTPSPPASSPSDCEPTSPEPMVGITSHKGLDTDQAMAIQ